MNVRATAKFVGTSQRKVSSVAALIRGRNANEAVTVLTQTTQRATEPVGKVLKSAIANAENNYRLKVGDLKVDSVLVGPGPTLKRYRPRAQGRAFPIFKRTSHITVILSDGSSTQVEAKPVEKASSAPKPSTAPPKPKKEALRANLDAKGSTKSQASARRTNQRKGNA